MDWLKCFEEDTYLGNIANCSILHKFKTPANEIYVVIDGHNVLARLLVGEEAINYINKMEKNNEQ